MDDYEAHFGTILLKNGRKSLSFASTTYHGFERAARKSSNRAPKISSSSALSASGRLSTSILQL